MSAWVYVDGPGATSWNRYVSYDDTNNNQIALFWDSDDDRYGFHYEGKGAVGQAHETGSDIPQGNWVLLVGTYDGSTARYYINDTEVATATVATTFDETNAHLTIGQRSDAPSGATDHVDARIDDVRVYNRALSQSEINDLYNTTK